MTTETSVKEEELRKRGPNLFDCRMCPAPTAPSRARRSTRTPPGFTSPASIQVDRQNGDIYIADGQSRSRNSRILVLDANGNFLRQWRITDMDSVHCMAFANDGTV